MYIGTLYRECVDKNVVCAGSAIHCCVCSEREALPLNSREPNQITHHCSTREILVEGKFCSEWDDYLVYICRIRDSNIYRMELATYY